MEAARAAALIDAAHPYVPLLPPWKQYIRRGDRDILRNLKLELNTMEEQARGGGSKGRGRHTHYYAWP